MSDNVYVIDSCALIDIWKNYPLGFKFTEELWVKIIEMFETKKIISSIEALEELKDEDLALWIKQYSKNFLPLDKSIQLKHREIINMFPKLINTKKSKKGNSNADPFLIATAILNQGIVVTSEKFVNAGDSYKIPNVCKHYNIRYIGYVEFLKEIMEG